MDGWTDICECCDGVSCDDVDECDLGTDECNDDATCANNVGSYYFSTCNAGYTGDGRYANVDECNIIGTCDANAACKDTVDSLLTLNEPLPMAATFVSVTMISMLIVLTSQILTSAITIHVASTCLHQHLESI